MSHDLRPLVDWVAEDFEPSVRVGPAPGSYAAVSGGPPSLYGSTDMLCVRSTLGAPQLTDAEASAWAAVINDHQDPDTGYFLEAGPASHVELHVTAYCVAALALLDECPRWPLAFAEPWVTPEGITGFLASLDWKDWVYLESHRGAGLGSLAFNVPDLVTTGWWPAYFGGLERHLDPANGMFGDGKPPGGDLDQIGGTFHYAFAYESAGRPLPHAAQRVEAVLGLQRDDGLWDPANPFWLTLDAVYLLSRAMDHEGVDDGRCAAAIRAALDGLAPALTPSGRTAAFGQGLGTHSLVAVLSTFAEAQKRLGSDEIVTAIPLEIVLDRRPFI
ncbi:MAG: hypothetical protein ABSF84_11985 [Acidimicrobiales bacterium]|jgi:hypothetical protein